jgi:hypothetical protein
MEGCAAKYSRRACEASEAARMALNRNQPPTQENHTEVGFALRRAPQEIMDSLLEFWQRYEQQAVEEAWPNGNTYTNHWDLNPTYMVSFENRAFREGRDVKQKVWDTVQPIIEEWVGYKTRPSSLYGIRIYKEGAMLAPHVDRLPLVSSAIINVAQDLDEPWPIEVYDHDGMASLARARQTARQAGRQQTR